MEKLCVHMEVRYFYSFGFCVVLTPQQTTPHHYPILKSTSSKADKSGQIHAGEPEPGQVVLRPALGERSLWEFTDHCRHRTEVLMDPTGLGCRLCNHDYQFPAMHRF